MGRHDRSLTRAFREARPGDLVRVVLRPRAAGFGNVLPSDDFYGLLLSVRGDRIDVASLAVLVDPLRGAQGVRIHSWSEASDVRIVSRWEAAVG